MGYPDKITARTGLANFWKFNQTAGATTVTDSAGTLSLTPSNITFGSTTVFTGISDTCAVMSGSGAAATANTAALGTLDYTSVIDLGVALKLNYARSGAVTGGPQTILSKQDNSSPFKGWAFEVQWNQSGTALTANCPKMSFIGTGSGLTVFGSYDLDNSTAHALHMQWNGTGTINGSRFWVDGRLAGTFATANTSFQGPVTASCQNTALAATLFKRPGTTGTTSGFVGTGVYTTLDIATPATPSQIYEEYLQITAKNRLAPSEMFKQLTAFKGVDTAGTRLRISGCGVTYEPATGLYWLFGQDMTGTDLAPVDPLTFWDQNHLKISCYSTRDFVRFTPYSNAFDGSTLGTPPFAISRPDVVYCAATSKWVMWAHCINDAAHTSHSPLIATADLPQGPYTAVSTTLDVNGFGDYRDCALYKHSDGFAYTLYRVAGVGMIVAKLASDYLTSVSYILLVSSIGQEAPVMFESGSTTIILTSDSDPYNRNQNRVNSYWTASSASGLYTKVADIFASSIVGTIYGSQSNFVIPVTGRSGWFLCGLDAWEGQTPSLESSFTVIVPFTFSGGTMSLVPLPTFNLTDLGTPTAVTAASDPVLTAGNNQVGVTWTNNQTGCSITVQRADDEDFTVNTQQFYVADGATSYTDSTVSNGTIYYYCIFTYNSGGGRLSGSNSATPSLSGRNKVLGNGILS